MNSSASINVHGVGFLFPNYFDDGTDYFAAFTSAHAAQNLTESNKGGLAYRKGIYLTEVKLDEETKETHFNLLRCSTNLQGPTENFSETDKLIINKANATAAQLFDNPAPLNHVLAQIYYNYTIDGKDRKAKIASHSDKTKDMPARGIMCFCTFYDPLSLSNKKYRMDPNNILYKNTCALTTLRFALKGCVKNDSLIKKFDVLLYPNSAFFMSLETNRLYTHEIVPPNLNSENIPTRLGYVIRCSKQPAKHTANQTYILAPDLSWITLKKPTELDRINIKKLYWEENIKDSMVDYGFIDYSLNDGDYLKPNQINQQPEVSQTD
jgi:hypothetical protein